MVEILRLLIVLWGLSITVRAANLYFYEQGDSPVKEYTGATNNFVLSHRPHIVEFYSPYCPACRRFSPEYKELAKAVTDQYSQAEFYGVSCAAHDDVCRDFEVKMFPALYAFPAGSSREGTLLRRGLAGSYSAKQIIEALDLKHPIEERTELNSIEIPDQAVGEYFYLSMRGNVQEYTGSGSFDVTKPRVVEFYSPFCEDCLEFRDTYIALADRMKETYPEVDFYAISCVHHSQWCQKYQITSYPSVFTYAAGSKIANKLDTNLDYYEGVVQSLRLNGKTSRIPRDTTSLEFEDEEEEPAEDIVDEFPTLPDEEEDEPVEDDKPLDEEGEDQVLPRSNVPATRSSGSAAAAARLPRDHDQYKEAIRERLAANKKKVFRKAKPGVTKLATSGATTTMRAHTPGTVEHTTKEKALELARARRQRAIDRANAAGPHTTKIELPRQQVKAVKKPKLAEKVPIMKRLVRMTAEEELILDVSLSFLHGLKSGVFTDNRPLSGKKKRALSDWLDLLSISLPPEWSLHEAIDDIRDNIDSIAQSPKILDEYLFKHTVPRIVWSPSCTNSKNPQGGFTCGFWKLLHIMSVGIAEYRGGLNLQEGSRNGEIPIFSPLAAASTVREYMAHFFPCTECASHFLSQYDQCQANRRCDRLIDVVEGATDDDWKELALWMWEFHNDVNVRLLHESADTKRKKASREAGPGKATTRDAVNVLWPTLRECLLCYKDDGSWDDASVFLYLEQTYWPGWDAERLFMDDPSRPDFQLFLVLCAVGFCVSYQFGKSRSGLSLAIRQVVARTKPKERSA